ncbi:MAG: hypothetical protein ACRENJ_08425, partial [Candidatus Eiseniibacteriota bacterium]
LALAARSAGAYGVSGVGGSGGYLSPEARDATGTLGMHAELEQPGTKLHLVPGVMYWGSDRRTDFNPNMDLIYHVLPDRGITPYLGAGIGVHLRGGPQPSDDANDLGMNLMGGIRFPGRAAHVFVEGRHTLSDVSQTALLAGATFHIGR